jgi:UDP-GlcNAc:undecaprenyl-phosphate/decaprenyl-phosphate GlcNAc-1-phosphate transferase
MQIVIILLFQILLSVLIINFSRHYKLLDRPDARKLHEYPVPQTGGFVIVILLMFIIFLTETEYNDLNNIFVHSFLICIILVYDDFNKISSWTKIILQSIPVFLLINENIFLTDLGNYFLISSIELGSFSKIFTILCILLLINSVNYSDGLDSLVCLISAIIMGSYYFYSKLIMQKEIDYFIYLIVILIIFSFFNFGFIKKYKIFLGDNGSNSVGFIIGFIAIFLYNTIGLHPSLVIWPLSYFIFEFLAVNITRLSKKKNFLQDGHDHIHYFILKITLNKYITISYILLINLFFSIVGYFLYLIFIPDFLIFIYIMFFFIFLYIRSIIYNKAKKKALKGY